MILVQQEHLSPPTVASMLPKNSSNMFGSLEEIDMDLPSLLAGLHCCIEIYGRYGWVKKKKKKHMGLSLDYHHFPYKMAIWWYPPCSDNPKCVWRVFRFPSGIFFTVEVGKVHVGQAPSCTFHAPIFGLVGFAMVCSGVLENLTYRS